MELYCAECDEAKAFPESLTGRRKQELRCSICGSALVERPFSGVHSSSIQPVTEPLNLLDILNSELRSAIQRHLAEQNPNRSVTDSFLTTAGVLTVDETKAVLLDIVMFIGPLKIMCIPAAFCPLPSSSSSQTDSVITIKCPLRFGSIEYGELPSNHWPDFELAKDSILVLKRGKVSFATKAIRAKEASCAALIIAQTEGSKW